jgi:hypothetical protein
MSTQVPHQRLKLAAVPVLAAILWMVFPSSPKAAPEEPLVELNNEHPKSKRPRASGRAMSGEGASMPTLSLADALRFDPFAVPESMQEPVEQPAPAEEVVTDAAPAQPEPPTPVVSFDHLQSLEVSAVIQGPRGAAAIVGSKAVRVGDLFEPGVRVVEIQPDRVLLRVENGKIAKAGEESSAP